MVKVDYTREELVAICEQAIVPRDRWFNRDTPDAQESVGKVWAALKAGCDFRVILPTTPGEHGRCVTDARTIWIEVTTPTFASFEYGPGNDEVETYYLPTPQRLEDRKGRDWY